MNYTPPATLFQKIGDTFNVELSPETAVEQAVQCHKLRYEVVWQLANTRQKLLEERERLRMPKDNHYTEFDRKTMSDAATAALERDYIFLQSIDDMLKERMQFCGVLIDIHLGT